MGFLDRLKVLNSPGLQAWLDTEERWAEIVAFRWVGPQRLRIAELRVALHFSDEPVKERTITCKIPKGIVPQAGQHVTFHWVSRGQYHPADVAVEWDEPPHYGQRYDPQAAAERFLTQFAMPAPGSGPHTEADLQAKRAKLEALRSAGALSDAEFDQLLRGLDSPASG